MPHTLISPLTYSPDEHNIVLMPDNETIQKIREIQHQLKSRLGDAVWLTPPNALHCTLMEIICPTDYGDLSRKELFTDWYEHYNEITKQVVANFQPFNVAFDELIVSPAAIILKAADTKAFNTIRKVLLENTILPAHTKIPPDITHCSIARYSKEVDLDKIREQAKGIEARIDLNVKEFKLMRDLGPDFHPHAIQTYRLRG